MRSIRRSNSSRNRTAARTFRSAYQAAASSASCRLPDGSEQTFASAVQSGAELTTNLVPRDRLNGTGIEISNPQCDLASPGLFGVFVDLRIQAVNERVGEGRPCRRGQFQSVR